MLLFEVTCGPIVFFLMINRVIWMERRQMGKQRGGREVVLRRVIPGQPAKEHSQVFQGHHRPNWWEHFLS